MCSINVMVHLNTSPSWLNKANNIISFRFMVNTSVSKGHTSTSCNSASRGRTFPPVAPPPEDAPDLE